MSLSFKFDEVLFVDSGSTDDSVLILKNHPAYIKKQIRLIQNETGEIFFPGKSRNIGIENSTGDTIVFLDVGVWPEKTFPIKTLEFMTKNHLDLNIGNCLFAAEGFFQKSVCSLSYGYMNILPALPGSVFKKDVFKKIGMFPEDLRAAEDLVLRKKAKLAFPNAPINYSCEVTYNEYPKNMIELYKKYKTYSVHTLNAGFGIRSHILILVFYLFLTLFSFYYPVTFLPLLCIRAYVGVLVKTNKKLKVVTSFWFWLFTPFIALLIDLGKVLGLISFGYKRFLST